MNRRGFLRAIGLGAVSLTMPGCTAGPGKSAAASGLPRRPNFVFFLIDDMGWTDVGCYGGKFHETPNIDRLARQGMKFTDAYAACPVCSPTRASILAGQYPARVGITDFIPGHQRPWEKLRVPRLPELIPPPARAQVSAGRLAVSSAARARMARLDRNEHRVMGSSFA